MQRKAFTLIELIAVMVVIVLLAYALIPRIGNMRAQAIRAYDEQTAITLANAIETTLTDGTLKTNNAPYEWSIVNYSNSPVSQMPYIQSPVLNSAIAMNLTNWPGYLITITNHDGSLYYYTGTGIPENGSTNLVAGSSGTGGSSGGAGIGGTAGAGGGASGSGGSGGSGGNNMYTLTYLTDGNGTISGSSSQTLSAGGTGTTVTAQPNSGYIFVGWSDSYPTSTRTDSNVQANLTVTASFAVVNTVDCSQNDSIASGPIYDLFQNNYVQARFPTFNPATTLPPDVNHQIDILEGGVFNPNISDGVLNEWVYRKYPSNTQKTSGTECSLTLMMMAPRHLAAMTLKVFLLVDT
jgi:prepilin-type N-terminal cleavage/methylation domain-containing protein/uncharacterized repeat protein (TIGR02543 family)